MRVYFVLSLLIAGCAKRQFELDPNQYIVVFKSSAVQEESSRTGEATVSRDTVSKLTGTIAARHALGVPRFTYSHVLQGAVYHIEADQLEGLKNDPNVAYVERDQRIHISEAVQNGAEWGLDRIDQHDLPLDGKYRHDDGGTTVNVYVIDTGVSASHSEFGGRAMSGADLVDSDKDATDCNGHGTHVAGTIASALYGVAKSAKIFGVRVLDCSGSGSIATVIAGIEWVTANHVAPAVANLSLGGGASQALDDAVSAGIASGVTFVVAAGNSNVDACLSSPARVPGAITVGAVGPTDKRSSFSNFGRCVDVFAPGEKIKSLGITNTTATAVLSGTSMASPHVAGVAVLYLSRHPTATPSEVGSAILNGAIGGKVTDAGAGSPDKLLNTLFLGESRPDPVPETTELKKDSPVELSGAKGSEKVYVIHLPVGVRSFKVALSGTSGDADLYVRSGSKPTTSIYDCRPYKSGSNEICNLTSRAAGDWYIMVRGYSAFTGAKLVATY